MKFTSELVNKLSDQFAKSGHVLFSELAIEFSRFEPPEIEFTMPFNGSFVTSTQTGAYPSGVISILLDSVLGIGSLVAIGTPVPVATLSLTVETISANDRGESLRAVGRSDAITKDIAYASGTVHGVSSGRLLARATGAFAIGTKGPGLGAGLLSQLDSKRET